MVSYRGVECVATSLNPPISPKHELRGAPHPYPRAVILLNTNILIEAFRLDQTEKLNRSKSWMCLKGQEA